VGLVGFAHNPNTPTPNPQSPIPIKKRNKNIFYKKLFFG